MPRENGSNTVCNEPEVNGLAFAQFRVAIAEERAWWWCGENVHDKKWGELFKARHAIGVGYSHEQEKLYIDGLTYDEVRQFLKLGDPIKEQDPWYKKT